MTRAKIIGGLSAAVLAGGLLLSTPTSVGVEVPTLQEFLDLEQRVADQSNIIGDMWDRMAEINWLLTRMDEVEARLSALESGSPPTTVPPTTTTTVPAAQLLPVNGVVPCDDCIVQGIEGHEYTSVNANGRSNVFLRDVVVNAAADSGPLQSGSVNVRGATDVYLYNVAVHDSPRSCFSLEGSAGITLDSVLCNGAEHLGIHGGFVTDIVIRSSELTDFSRRNADLGWESGGIKLAIGRNVTVENTYVHDGNGPGIWFDIDFQGGQVLNNVIEHTSGEGIFIEIARDINVEGNTVTGAPYFVSQSRMDWCYGAGILISTSDQVTVTGNTVRDSVHGIIVLDQSWRADTPQAYDASAYSVSGNTVEDVNKTGACQDVGSTAVFDGAWSNNTWLRVQSLLPPL